MADGVRIAVADQQLVSYDERAEGIAEACPLGDELAVGSKDLNSLVAAICDIDSAFRSMAIPCAAANSPGPWLVFRAFVAPFADERSVLS